MMSCENVTVELQPFDHQVGGHNIVLQINKSTICKPYLDREVNFYNHLPEELKEFTPSFQGVIDVKCSPSNGSFVFHSDIPQGTLDKCGYKLLNSTNSEESGPKRVSYFSKANQKQSSRMCNEKSNQEDWSRKCIERHIKSWSINPSQKFIILGNLLESCQKPCIMDLKMGTKQHADIATEEKRKLLEERCAASTSSTLGFRINGSQMYKADGRTCISRDKYFGRQLDTSGVHSELYYFFHDGHCLRREVVKMVKLKLKSLHNILSNQKTFCFLSCSLLILYDSASCFNQSSQKDSKLEINTDKRSNACSGHSNSNELQEDIDMLDSNSDRACKADVRLIDFAHTLLKSDIGGQVDGYECGLLNGLQNLIKILEQILQKPV